MRGVQKWVLLVAACATALFSSTVAFGQQPAAGPNPTVAAQDSAYAPRYKWSPVYTNLINGTVSYVEMKNSLVTGLTTPWGSTFNFEVSASEKNYRLQSNQVDRNKLLRLSDLHVFSPFWMGSVNASDSRVFNRSITQGGGVTDFIINDQQASLNSTYRRTMYDVLIGNVRTDVQGTGGVIRSERAFKNDRGIQAGANGGFAYDLGELFTIQGRGSLRNSWDRSSTIDSTITGLGSDEDSLMTGLTFQSSDSIRFEVSHKRYNGDRDFTDQATGSLGGQLSGAENVLLESETRNTRNTAMLLSSHVGRRFTLSLGASHDEQTYDYAVNKSRFTHNVTDGVNGTVTYSMPWKTVALFTFEGKEALTDYGPNRRSSSLTDKSKRVSLKMDHSFSKTFTMGFSGSSAIAQQFYLDPKANPRDRDQVDTSLNLSIRSQLFTKFSANISLAYGNTEIVNIDSTQSQDNRVRELWDFRPGFTYMVTPNLSIVQIYGLSFEYVDYDYEDTQNYLDRNITFSNEFRFRPMRNVSTSFLYRLTRHNKGSYLPDPITGERFLNTTSRDTRQETEIRVDYRMTQAISFFAEQQYSRFDDEIVGTDEVDATITGQVMVGTQASYDWGGGKKLNVLMSRVKVFNPNNQQAAAKDYWDARSEIVYSF